MLSQNRRHSRWILIALSLTMIFAVFASPALAEVVGKLTRVEGAVDIMPGGELPAVAAREGTQVQKGDFIRTKSNSKAELTFNDGSVVKIAQRSRIDVSEYSGTSRKLALPRGKVQATVVPAAAGAQRTFEIRTPNAIAGVRGTVFFVYHQANVTGVAVQEGVVHTTSINAPGKGVTLVAGTATTVTKRNAPTPPRPVTEKEMNSHQGDVAPSASSGGESQGPSSGSDGEGSAQPGASGAPTANSGPTGAGGSPADSGDTKVTGDFGPTSNPLPTPDLPPNEPPKPPPFVPEIKVAPILFSAGIGGGLMSRGSSIDPVSGLLTIISDPGFGLKMSGTTSLWGGNATATLGGVYPTATLAQPNHYWLGKFFSDSNANNTTADGGAFFGYTGGMAVGSTGSIDTTLSALYVDPTGKIGIMQGGIPGTISAGGISGSGTLNLTQLGSSTLTPSSFGANWWNSPGSAIAEVTGPVMADDLANSGTGSNDKGSPSEGFLFDAALNFTGEMTHRGDVVKLGYLAADPSFGIWSRESFGSYAGSGSKFALITNADWGTPNGDGTFTLNDSLKIISLGNWQEGALTGRADGVWGNLATGSIRLLTGTLVGSANPGTGTFGAVSTGSFIDLNRFLANPTLAANLGFATVPGSSFSLAGSGPSGDVSLGTVTFYSRNPGDKILLWVAPNITGTRDATFTGSWQNQHFSLMDGGSASTSNVMGSMQISSISPAVGGNTWIGSLNAMGQLADGFSSDFDGVAAGHFTSTGFTGSAAGLAHPVTYYNRVAGNVTRYEGGAIASYGSMDGIMGGMSLWTSTPTDFSDFKGVGFLNPSQALVNSDYVMSAPIQSLDVVTATPLTKDGGAYRGSMVAGISGTAAGNGGPGMIGVLNALTVDPNGNAGILHGKLEGFLDQSSGLWMADGAVYPVTLLANSGINPATLGSTGVVPVNTTFTAGGTFFSGTSPSISTWAPVTFTRSYLAAAPQWGIGEFGLYATYSIAPTASTPWSIDFAMQDSAAVNVKLAGTMFGQQWDPTRGQMAAQVRAGWLDMQTANAAATPATGIFIGETVGTFNPASLQAMTSGIWMESSKFIQTALNNPDALKKLNIPAVEVGKADFSGSSANFDVNIQNLKFYAPVSGGRPQVFATDGFSGNYYTASPIGSVNLTQTGGINTSGFAPTFSINQWDGTNNKWGGSIQFSGNTGTVGTSGNVQFNGVAAGRSSGGVPGTFTGTAAGVVR